MPNELRKSILQRFLQFFCCCLAIKVDDDDTGDNNDDIIVTRVYKSTSAEDFVDMHGLFAGFPYMPKASRSDLCNSATKYKVFNHKEWDWKIQRNSIPLDRTDKSIVGDGKRDEPIEDGDDLEIINAF